MYSYKVLSNYKSVLLCALVKKMIQHYILCGCDTQSASSSTHLRSCDHFDGWNLRLVFACQTHCHTAHTLRTYTWLSGNSKSCDRTPTYPRRHHHLPPPPPHPLITYATGLVCCTSEKVFYGDLKSISLRPPQDEVADLRCFQLKCVCQQLSVSYDKRDCWYISGRVYSIPKNARCWRIQLLFKVFF